MTIILIIVGIVVLLVLWFIAVANKLAKKKMKAEQAFADVDVYLTQRYDLIPNLVSTVKGYSKHEKETFEAVVKARNAAVNAGNMNEKIDADNVVTEAIGKLFALAEAYPELKANENFVKLQDSLESVEKDLVGARRYFNAAAQEYNFATKVIPDTIVAGILGYKPISMFTASEEQRQNVKVDFEN
ncbi:MAG: LemA family protein [Bacilli bacterium]|nr:LemA family protein [Bacilli bacterium]